MTTENTQLEIMLLNLLYEISVHLANGDDELLADALEEAEATLTEHEHLIHPMVQQ